MLPPVAADSHVARPFATVLASNVPGDYPPDQWADTTLRAFITVGDGASDERKRKAAAFIAQARETLIRVFIICQEREQVLLASEGADHYAADLGIDELVIHASGAIVEAAREHLVFGPVNLGDILYAPNRLGIANTIGTNLATSVNITRRWHAHAREDDPRARAFLGV